MTIKREKFQMYSLVKADEFGDRPKRLLTEPVEPRFDYDFYTDEVIELERLREPCKLIPQDNLKYAIINIIAYICSDLVVDYLARYCRRAGSEREDAKCSLVISF